MQHMLTRKLISLTMCHRMVSLLRAGYVTGIHFIFTTNFEINNYAPFIFTFSFNSCTHNK